MRTNPLCATLASLVLFAGAARALALEVGDRAPEIDVSEWVQGEPAKLADDAGKKTWLVVLWGTFESDCIDGLPSLNKVYEKNKAAGFEIVAVSTEPADRVRTFLGHHKLEYRVAVDQFHKTADAYGKDVRKLPMSWLVDKEGIVVWKGDPTAGLDRILEAVLGGKFDLKRAQEIAERQQSLWKALFANDWDALAVACEKILELEPGDTQAFSFRMWAFTGKNDHEGFKTFMKKHLERCKDDAGALRRAAEQLAVEGSYEWRDVDLALSAAKRAVEISKSADADALETYGRVLFTLGLPDLAVEQQKKAVALEAKDESHKQLLAYYEACVAARKKATAPQPPAPPKKK